MPSPTPIPRTIPVPALSSSELARIEQRFLDYWASHQREHDMLRDQVKEAYTALGLKLSEMNEMRSQMAQERGMFDPRERADARHEATIQRFTQIENAMAGWVGKFAGLGVGLGVLVFIVEFAFRYWQK
jgi:hypothetical protein